MDWTNQYYALKKRLDTETNFPITISNADFDCLTDLDYRFIRLQREASKHNQSVIMYLLQAIRIQDVKWVK